MSVQIFLFLYNFKNIGRNLKLVVRICYSLGIRMGIGDIKGSVGYNVFNFFLFLNNINLFIDQERKFLGKIYYIIQKDIDVWDFLNLLWMMLGLYFRVEYLLNVYKVLCLIFRIGKNIK